MQLNCKQIFFSVNCFAKNNSAIAYMGIGGGYFCSIINCIRGCYAKIARQFLAGRTRLLHYFFFGVYFLFSAVSAILTRKSHRARISQKAVFRCTTPHRPLFCVCVGWWSQKFPLKDANYNGHGELFSQIDELPVAVFHLILLLILTEFLFFYFFAHDKQVLFTAFGDIQYNDSDSPN